jgi:hemerythrin-like metal-binding protein
VAAISWKPEYDLGSDALNQQHRLMFAMFDRLRDAILQGLPQGQMFSLFAATVCLVEQQLHQQEAAMRASGYPGLLVHLKEHAGLLLRLHRLGVDMAGGHFAMPVAQLETLEGVFGQHIVGPDRGYASYILENGLLANGGRPGIPALSRSRRTPPADALPDPLRVVALPGLAETLP